MEEEQCETRPFIFGSKTDGQCPSLLHFVTIDVNGNKVPNPIATLHYSPEGRRKEEGGR